MLYSLLIYGIEGVAEALPPEEQEALLDKHRALQARLQQDGTYRGAVQLMPPSSASHVTEKAAEAVLMDGPFAESKEQFLGFYLIECESFDYAVEAARALPQGIAHVEVRAVRWSSGL